LTRRDSLSKDACFHLNLEIPMDINTCRAKATKVLTDAQELRNKAGEAQRAADHAKLGLPGADKASVQATAACGILDKAEAAKAKIAAAGGDASVLDDLVEYADTLATSAQRYVLDAQAAVG